MTEKNSDFIEVFLLLVHLADGGAKGGTQAVKLLLHGRPLLLQALHLISCIGQRLEFTASIGSGVPVVDERLLLLIVLLLALSRFLVKKGLFIGKFLLVVSFLVEPVGHFFGTVVLLLRFTHFCLESSDFIGDFCLCRLVQECDVLQQVFQPVALILLFLAGVIDLFADFGIDIGAGHLLEQVGFLVIVAVQELGKFALSEHDCAEELLHVQPDSLLDKLFNLFDFAVVAVLGRTLVGHDHAHGLLDSAIHLVARAVHVPCGLVGDAVVIVKGQLNIGADGPATQQLPHVVGPEAFLVLALSAAAGVVCPLGGIQARRVAIQGQADAVDDSGFARPRFSGDQEQMLVGQRCGIKIDYGMLDGCDIVDCEFLEFHCLFASWTN